MTTAIDDQDDDDDDGGGGGDNDDDDEEEDGDDWIAYLGYRHFFCRVILVMQCRSSWCPTKALGTSRRTSMSWLLWYASILWRYSGVRSEENDWAAGAKAHLQAGHGFNSCSPETRPVFHRTFCTFAPLNSSILELHVSLDLTLPVQGFLLVASMQKKQRLKEIEHENVWIAATHCDTVPILSHQPRPTPILIASECCCLQLCVPWPQVFLW